MSGEVRKKGVMDVQKEPGRTGGFFLSIWLDHKPNDSEAVEIARMCLVAYAVFEKLPTFGCRHTDTDHVFIKWSDSEKGWNASTRRIMFSAWHRRPLRALPPLNPVCMDAECVTPTHRRPADAALTKYQRALHAQVKAYRRRH